MIPVFQKGHKISKKQENDYKALWKWWILFQKRAWTTTNSRETLIKRCENVDFCVPKGSEKIEKETPLVEIEEIILKIFRNFLRDFGEEIIR